MSADERDPTVGPVSEFGRREQAKQAVLACGEAALLELWWAAEKLQALLTAALAQHVRLAEALADSDTEYERDLRVRLASSSLAVESRSSDLTMAKRLHEAARLRDRLPRVLEAWLAGELHRGHVKVIERHSDGLTGQDLVDYETEALVKAAGRSPRQLGPALARVARRLAPEPVQERFEAAFAKRGVWVTPAGDGTSIFSIHTASVLAEAALNRLHQGAKAQERGGEATAQQWMADAAMAHLITGTTTGDGVGLLDGIAAKVVVTMPATVLTGPDSATPTEGPAAVPSSDDASGLSAALAPGGPRDWPAGRGGLLAAGWCHMGDGHAELRSGQLVDDDTARLLAGRCVELVRLFTDPITGVPVWVDRHDPTPAQRRALLHRDQTCRFPGCATKAEWCDADHTRPHGRGGPTCLCNLGCLCRRHHGLKHLLGDSHGWTVTQPRPGVFAWTGPTGRLCLTEAEPSPAAIIVKPLTPGSRTAGPRRSDPAPREVCPLSSSPSGASGTAGLPAPSARRPGRPADRRV